MKARPCYLTNKCMCSAAVCVGKEMRGPDTCARGHERFDVDITNGSTNRFKRENVKKIAKIK